MKNSIITMSFLAAESVALNLAYKQFFGVNEPIGIPFTFIRDREKGNAWTDEEKEVAKSISRKAISELRYKNLVNLIVSGVVPDCAMARRFMATGSPMTEKGYNF